MAKNNANSLSFFDPKTGVTYAGLGAFGTIAASTISANTTWNSLGIAVGVGLVLGFLYMGINKSTPGASGTPLERFCYGLLNAFVLVFTVFGGMAALDKTTPTDTTQLKTEDAVAEAGVPPAPPTGDLPPVGNVQQVPPTPGSSG